MSTITEDGIEFEFPALKEAQAEIDAKQQALATIFEEAGPDLDMSKVKSVTGGKDAVVARIRELNSELEDLGKKRDELKDIAKGARLARRSGESGSEGDDPEPAPGSLKSAGKLFAESGLFKSRQVTKEFADFDLKTLFQRSAGWAPESTRSGLVVLDAQRPVQVTQLLPQIPTEQGAYKYMEETTFTNGAVEISEGSAYGEAALVLTERSKTIEKIGVWLPMTDEQLEDEAGAAAYVDARLPFMVMQRLDGQILNGDGNTPNITGINQQANIQTQAKGADPTPDAIFKAMTKVRDVGRAITDAVILHPNDWQDIRLLRTADGVYIWGNPSEAGPERIWGVQIVQCDAQAENTGVVGDFGMFSLLVMRRGLEVKVTDTHDDFFIKGKQAIRADLRCATVWIRPEAFATVTGI